MIDKSYYKANMAIYYRDYLFFLAAFVASYIWCLYASGVMFVIAFLISVCMLYWAGSFLHEITHRQRDERMKPFTLLWNLTLGAIVQVPAPRFFYPHLTHHTTGIFRTKDDPQYLMLRSDRKLAIFVLVCVPFLMPILNYGMMVTASLGMSTEDAIERFLRRHGYTMGSVIEDKYRQQVGNFSRYHLVVFVAYAALLPETLPLLYCVQVGGWWLVTLRIPLEHRMESYLETSDARDHLIDTFTVESRLAAILQPLGLQYHTAHHLYPGVPYHKLRALHFELKAKGDPDYCVNVISFWRAVRGGPKTAV